MLRHLFAVARVEWLRLARTRATLTLLLIVPVLQVLLFGHAIRPDAASVRVAVAAPAPVAARRVIAELRSRSSLDVNAHPLGPGAAEAMVRSGKALIAVELPDTPSFANPFGKGGPVRVVVDATNASLGARAIGQIEAAYWQGVATRAADGPTGPGIAVERLYNPPARADWTFLPALAGVTAMIAMVMLGSLSVARERETGTWDALRMLPVDSVVLLAGRTLPATLLGTLQAFAVLAIARLAFDLPMLGDVVALIALLPPFAAAHFVLGHLLAARAATQIAALQAAVAFYLPAMLLSGFLYPFATLPGWAQIVGNAFPLTHFIRAAHAATLQGAAAPVVLGHGLPIAAFLIAAFIAATLALLRGR